MTDSGDLRVEGLQKHHDRGQFSCGEPSLDVYLKTQAGQDMRRKANAVFVLVSATEPSRIAGYFTLCATALAQGEVPTSARPLVPRYPLVSATLIGRLAVDLHFQGHGLGSILLFAALRRACESAAFVGSSMVIVEALHPRAAQFYMAHNFQPLRDTNRLILPMRVIERLLNKAQPDA